MSSQDVTAIVDAIVSHERFDTLFTMVAQNTTDIKEIKDRLSSLEERVDRLTRAVESLASSVNDLTMEYSAMKMQMARYDAWFKQIADHVGIELKS